MAAVAIAIARTPYQRKKAYSLAEQCVLISCNNKKNKSEIKDLNSRSRTTDMKQNAIDLFSKLLYVGVSGK